MKYSHEELERCCERLQNQVQALKRCNLILLEVVGQLAKSSAIDPALIELLRGQYRAVNSLSEPKR